MSISTQPSDEESPYDVFVSYARADNGTGWVGTLVDGIRQQRTETGAPLRVFFDTEAINSMNDWQLRIEAALRRSRVLLICLSPAYRDSRYCRWEWLHFNTMRAARRGRHAESAAVVRFVVVPGSDPATEHAWVNQVRQVQLLLDLKDWFADAEGRVAAPQAWAAQAGEQEARRIFERLWSNIRDERAAQRAQGNLRGGNPHFVGRTEALRDVHRTLTGGKVGVVCAVQGLGGIGKTELALQYAYEHAWNYTAGLWQLSAAGRSELLPLLAELAQDSCFLHMHGRDGQPLQATPEELADATKLGRRVWLAMLERAQRLRDDERAALRQADYTLEPHGGGAVLVILDNVDDPALLSQRQLTTLPELNQARDRVRLLATSRIGRGELPARDVQMLELGRLGPDEALALFMTHRQQRPFPDAAYDAAVGELIRLLDGYTLPLEQVAVYLGLNDEVRPESLKQAFADEGLTLADDLLTADARVGGEILHAEQLMDIVLDQTLSRIDRHPLARSALNYAALLPPDHISWEWLRVLAEADVASPAVPAHMPSPWKTAQRQLQDAQLLTPGEPGATRLHGLIGDHLRRRLQKTAVDELARMQMSVDVMASQLSFQLERQFAHSLVRPWSALRTLSMLVSHWLDTGRSDSAVAFVSDVVAGIELDFGRFSSAEPLIRAATAIREELAHANPNNLQVQRDLIVSLNKLVEFLSRRGAQGDISKALHHLEQSLGICEALAVAHPADLQAQDDLAIWLDHFASLLFHRGTTKDVTDGLRHLERGLQIREAIAAISLDSRFQRGLVVSLVQIAGALQRRGAPGDTARELECLERSLEIHEVLAGPRPNDNMAQRELAMALNNISIFLLRRNTKNDAEIAFRHITRSLQIRELLALANPKDSQAQRDLFLSLDKLADCLLHSNETSHQTQAVTYLEQGLDICENRAAADPDDSEAKRDIASVHARLATAATLLNDLNRAAEHRRVAFNIRQALFNELPTTAHAEGLATAAWNLCAQLTRQGTESDPEEIDRLAKRTHELLSLLAHSDAMPPHLRSVYTHLQQRFKTESLGGSKNDYT